MREERIAARYGRALFLCVEGDETLLRLEGELATLASAFKTPTSELKTLFLNPSFSTQERAQVIETLSRHFSLHDILKNLLLLLNAKGRLALLPPIVHAFGAHIDLHLGRVRAQIRSASPLSDSELGDILSALKTRLGKQIIPDVAVEPNLVIGTKAQIGGMVFDGTLTTLLDRFKRRLVDLPVQ